MPCSGGKPDCIIGTTCDITTKTCRSQLGGFCGDGNENSCVSGAICDIDQRCKLDFGGNCKDNIMHCRSGIFCDWDGKCKYGTSRSCLIDGQCPYGALCMNSTCRCMDVEAVSDGTICVPRPGFVGGYCDDVTSCKIGNATCINNNCECFENSRSNTGFHCDLVAKASDDVEEGGYLWIVLLIVAIVALISFIGFLVFRRKHKKEVMQKLKAEMDSRMAQTKLLASALEKRQIASSQKKTRSEGLTKGSEASAKDKKVMVVYYETETAPVPETEDSETIPKMEMRM